MTVIDDFDAALTEILSRPAARALTSVSPSLVPPPAPLAKSPPPAIDPLPAEHWQLVVDSLNVVGYMVGTQLPRGSHEAEDAYQDGVLGLIAAVRRHDQRGNLGSFAIPWIRHAIWREIRRRAAQRDGRPLTSDPSLVQTVSLDAPVNDEDDGFSIAELLVDEDTVSDDDALEETSTATAVALLATVCRDDIDRTVAANWLADAPLSENSLAESLGITYASLRRRRAVLVSRLVHPSSSALLDALVGRGAQRWHVDAACRENPGVDVEFFPAKGGKAAAAKAVCAGCPVSDECLAAASDNPDLHGVWGGTSKTERDVAAGRTTRRTGAAGRCSCGATIGPGSTRCPHCRPGARQRQPKICVDCGNPTSVYAKERCRPCADRWRSTHPEEMRRRALTWRAYGSSTSNASSSAALA